MPNTSIICQSCERGASSPRGDGPERKSNFQKNQLSDTEISDMSTGEAGEHEDLSPKPQRALAIS